MKTVEVLINNYRLYWHERLIRENWYDELYDKRLHIKYNTVENEDKINRMEIIMNDIIIKIKKWAIIVT